MGGEKGIKEIAQEANQANPHNQAPQSATEKLRAIEKVSATLVTLNSIII